MTSSLPPIPRRPFAIAMALATVIAVQLAVFVAGRSTSDSSTLIAVGAFIAFGGALAAIPLLGPAIIPPSWWGMAVLGVSGGRTLIALLAILVLTQVFGFEKRPVALGLLTGTIVLMIVEAAVAVWLLSRREHARLSQPTALIGATGPADSSGSVA